MSFIFGMGLMTIYMYRSGMHGSQTVRLVDDLRNKHTGIAVTDYIVATSISYTHAVAPFRPVSETKHTTFYIRPVQVLHVGKEQ